MPEQTKMTPSRFAEIVSSRDWQTIDDMVAALNQARYWDREFTDHALVESKKSHARQMARATRKLGIASLISVTKTQRDGKRVRIYKQLALFNVQDYRYCVRYHRTLGFHHMKEANHFAREGTQATHTQIPLPFPNLDDDGN